MDLFVVNRYLGDESTNNNDADEKAKLDLLLKKVEERKKQRKRSSKHKADTEILEAGESNLDVATHTPSEVSPKDPISEPDVINEDTGTSKRKRKKKQKHLVGSFDENENDAVGKDNQTGTAVKSEGFTVIGVDRFKKKQKVKSVLPYWLANPSVVSVNLQNLTTTVKGIPGIDKDLVQILEHNNITHFFPVQAQVIPWLLTANTKPKQYWPQDVCVSAPTGSGKTLAFVIPIVQALRHRMVVRVRALVVLPVQDLAVQVYKVFVTYTKTTDLEVALVTGQTSFPAEQKQLVTCGVVSGYRSLVDIIVTTPGRLVDHLKATPGFSLKDLRYLVIDEADRVIDNIQNDWLYHVYSHINTDSKTSYHAPPLTISTLESTTTPPPQKLLFSATLTQDPEKLQQLGLFQPKLFTSIVGESDSVEDSSGGGFIGKYTTPAELTEYMCVVSLETKPLVLYHLVTSKKWKHVLVFVGSKKDAHRLSLLLKHLGQGKLNVADISSDLSRIDREKILNKFASGALDIIVSSDALARGMDIGGVEYVVLYNAPKSVKNYIHRVGRTGRAGKQGTAVTLLLDKQIGNFNNMLRIAGKDKVKDLAVEDSELEELEDAYRAALENLKMDLGLKAERRKKKVDPLIQKLRNKKRQRKERRKKRKESQAST